MCGKSNTATDKKKFNIVFPTSFQMISRAWVCVITTFYRNSAGLSCDVLVSLRVAIM